MSLSDGPALLRGILDNPADDAPRLIYSDWLEDNGEEERARFIRLQIRIANLQSHCSCGSCVKLRGGGQCTNGPCAVDRERDELPDGRSKQAFLRMKLHELCGPHKRGEWGDNYFKWFLEDYPAAYGLPYGPTVARGFVSSVSLTCALFVGGLCATCNGSGRNGYSGTVPVQCDDCGGTGRIEGVARELFSRHPITEVRLVDALPCSMTHWGEFGWCLPESSRGRNRGTIPAELFIHLPKSNKVIDGRGQVSYRSEADANAALSRAAVAYGRQLAGLEPLPAESNTVTVVPTLNDDDFEKIELNPGSYGGPVAYLRRPTA